MIHGSKNIYFQNPMFSSTSRMYYGLYNNIRGKIPSVYLIVQFRLLSMDVLFLFFCNTVLYFPYIIPKLFPVQPSLMNVALGF